MNFFDLTICAMKPVVSKKAINGKSDYVLNCATSNTSLQDSPSDILK